MRDPIPAWARARFDLREVDVLGNRIPYLAGGSGDPVVLIHGLSGSLDWWQYNASALAERFQVFLVDLPGFGRLGHLTVCHSMPEYVDWLRNWMRAANIERSHLIGHSMGGHISMRLAAESPGNVDHLVLVAPAGVVPSRELPHYVLPLIRMLRDIPVALLPLAIRDIRRANPRTVWQSSHDLIEQHVLDILNQIQAPTLIVWGDKDPILLFSFAQRFQEAIVDAELLVLPGAGHIPMIDDPETFNSRVQEFLGNGRSGH